MDSIDWTYNTAIETAALVVEAEQKRLEACAMEWLRDPSTQTTPGFSACAIVCKRIAKDIRALKQRVHPGDVAIKAAKECEAIRQEVEGRRRT